MTRYIAICLISLGLTAAQACAPAGEGEAPGEPVPDPGAAGASCSAQVTIGLYKDDQCAHGTEVLTVVMDLSKECSTWSRSTGTGTRDNSATRFQCYRDRLCYTQHVASASCSASEQTDKESQTTCMKDETPGIRTRILGGTEGCPVAPAGFLCPQSDPGRGTAGLKACAGT